MNVRLSFLLIAVLIIFGGTFLVFHFTRAAEPTEDPPWLYKVDDDSIVHIEVTYQGKTVNYNKKPGGTTWYIQDNGQETPVLVEKWSGTPLLLSGPRVNRLLSQTVDNPKIYGLDPPESIVKVTERSGITYEFRMGDPTPDGQNQYAYLVGNPQLFTVPQIWADVINRLVYDPPYPRPYYIAKDNSIIHFGVLNTKGDAVDFRKQTGTEDWVVMGAPGTPDTPVSQERWQQVMPLMNEPPISLVVSDKIDDATKYGLKPPKARVLITTTKEKPFDLYIGDPMPDGEHRYVQKRGDNKLFAMPESWVAMLEDLASDPPYASTPQQDSSSSGN